MRKISTVVKLFFLCKNPFFLILISPSADLPIPPPPILRDELIDTALFALNSNAHNTAKALSLIDTALAVVYDGGGSSATNGLDNPSTLATLVADLNAKRNSINWSLDERKLFMVGIERFGRDPYQISKLVCCFYCVNN